MEQLFFIRLNNRDCLLLHSGTRRTLRKENNSLRMNIYIYTYTYTSIEIYQNYFYFKDDLLFLLILKKKNEK